MYSKYHKELREKRALVKIRKEASLSPMAGAVNHTRSIESIDSFGSVSQAPQAAPVDNNDLRNRANERVQKWMNRLQNDDALKGKASLLIFI